MNHAKVLRRYTTGGKSSGHNPVKLTPRSNKKKKKNGFNHGTPTTSPCEDCPGLGGQLPEDREVPRERFGRTFWIVDRDCHARTGSQGEAHGLRVHDRAPESERVIVSYATRTSKPLQLCAQSGHQGKQGKGEKYRSTVPDMAP